MKRALYLAAMMLIPIGPSTAQIPSAGCPSITIHCPYEMLALGEPATIHVKVSGAALDASLKFNWSVSAGKITRGQNTPTITVDTRNLAGQTVTATVELEGLLDGCDKIESCSLIPIEFATSALRFGSYGDLSFEKEKSRLANFGIQLQQEPGSEGYIVFYGARRIKQRLQKAQKFLADKFGIDPQRITGMNGGYSRKVMVELWIGPIGAGPPPLDRHP